MPSISGSFNPQLGPILPLAIVDLASADQSVQGGLAGELPPALHTYDALIDTGATDTCISQRIVDDLGLVPTGKILMAGATGVSPVDQFTFGVGLLLPSAQTQAGSGSAGLLVKRTQGCLFEKGAAAFDVLLGRDIICTGAFHLSYDGHFTLSV